MARSVNKVILIGNLGRDAETKYTPQGVAVSRFSIATTRRIKDNATNEWKDETDWNNVTLWRNENLAPYLQKGKQVYVEGRLQTRSYQDKDGVKKYSTEVVAEDVILLGGRGGGDGEGGGGGYSPAMQSGPRSASQRMSPPAAAANSGPEDFDPGIGDDDVPF